MFPSNYSSCYTCLNDKITKSDWTSPSPPLIWSSLAWIILEGIVHPETSLAWSGMALICCCCMDSIHTDVIFVSGKVRWNFLFQVYRGVNGLVKIYCRTLYNIYHLVEGERCYIIFVTAWRTFLHGCRFSSSQDQCFF